jgi:hypothetical protein
MTLVLNVQMDKDGGYEYVEITEEGRRVFRSNWGNMALELRIVDVVAGGLRERGDEVVEAEDYAGRSAALGYNSDSEICF